MRDFSSLAGLKVTENYFFGWLGGWLEKVELRLSTKIEVEVDLKLP